MMIEMRFNDDRQQAISYYPLSGIVGILFTLEITSLLYGSFMDITFGKSYVSWINLVDNTQNIVSLGSILYNFYGLIFILASVVLLVGMIGAIFISAYHRLDTKTQRIQEQNQRIPEIQKIKIS